MVVLPIERKKQGLLGQQKRGKFMRIVSTALLWGNQNKKHSHFLFLERLLSKSRFLFFRKCSIVFLLIGWLLASPSIAQEPMRLPVSSTPLTIETPSGKVRFDVEIATSPQELSRGLMFRTDFPRSRAMLFVFGRTHMPSMWMKNTPLPLDMLFVNAEGKIVSIFTDAQPFSEATINSAAPAAYVIEINAGEAHSRAIKEGARVIHPIICASCAD